MAEQGWLKSQPQQMPLPKVAYIMSRFPHLPETFIVREMNELERQGWTLALYPLIRQNQAVIHAEALPWLPAIREQPYLSAQGARANLSALVRSPRQTARMWSQSIWGNRQSPKFFLRALALLPKAADAARQMQAEGVRHIHAHYATHPALFAWMIHRLTGISYSFTAHAHDLFVDTTMLAVKAREAAFIVAISEYNRGKLAAVCGESIRRKTRVIHCGIDPQKYLPRETSHRIGDRLELIHTGSLQAYKGQADLITACALLRERQIPFHCRIIGAGVEEPHLRQKIAQLGLDEQVELLGAQPEEQVAQLLSSAHLYLQPSLIMPDGKMEGIPVALMEAMASGLPVIASRISGIPELVEHEVSGLLTPPADPTAVANAVELLYCHPEEARRLAGNGREKVLQEFTLEKNVTKLAHLFRQIARLDVQETIDMKQEEETWTSVQLPGSF